LVPAGPAGAHPTLNARLKILNQKIAAAPGDAGLRLSRAALYADEEHFDEALRDVDAALALDPGLSLAHLIRAQVLLATGHAEEAAAPAELFVVREPSQPRGWQTAARVAAARSRLAEADASWRRYFDLAEEPRPEDYLERAAARVRAGDSSGARALLEEGVERLGPLTALLQELLEIDVAASDLAAALADLDRLATSSPQTERWLLRRAELLHAAARDHEALDALDRADESLARRPAARRSAGPLHEIAAALRALRGEIAHPKSSPGSSSSPEVSR